jgi:hypothetical protein
LYRGNSRISTDNYNIKLYSLEFINSGEGLSLPGGRIYMKKGDISNSITNRNSVNTLIHEFFHQYQYENIQGAALFLINELLYNNNMPYENSTYATGDYRYSDLSKVNFLSELPLEGQATLVGDFAELFFAKEQGFTLSNEQKNALYHQARILSLSGFNSEVISSQMINIVE